MQAIKALLSRRACSVLVVTAFGVLASAGAASANTFTVNDKVDAALSNPAGTTCASTHGGSCTLRAAVQAADNTGGANAIVLPAGTYQLTIASAAANDPSTGDLDIDDTNGATSPVALTITGAGASSTTIDGTHNDRLFAVGCSTVAGSYRSAAYETNGCGSSTPVLGQALAITGVTLVNGQTTTTGSPDLSTAPGFGGAFYNDGSLSIDKSVLDANNAYGGGGAVFADADATSTTITNSVVSQNAAYDSVNGHGYPYGSAEGGGVVELTSGALTFTSDLITNNTADEYGGVVSADEERFTPGAFKVTSTVMSDSAADSDGGAMYLDYIGPLTISGSEISNNVSESDGGAIEDDNSSLLTVSNSTFTNDAAADDSDGGAIYTSSTDLSVSNSKFTDDSGCCGGALYVDGSSDTAQQTVSNSVFSYDQAADTEGGAIYADYGPLAITNSTMDHNNAADEGGGVYYDSGDGFSMTNTTLDSNQAGGEGGGIEFATTTTTGSVSLLNDTIARNTSNEGGGIYFNDSPAAYSIENTIVADNSAGWTTDGRNDCYYDSATGNAGAADHGGNLDSDGSCFALPADQVATNPGLDALGNYGGPSAGNPFDASTVGTDLLSAGSPAIGNAVAADCPATDERGVARSTTQGRCDIGALQTAPAALTVGNSAPSSVAAGAAFGDTIVVSNGGPSPSSHTTVTDSVPAGESVYAANASQGSCSVSGPSVTCALGVINSGQSATISLAVSTSKTVTNTASASNDQGSSKQASATTTVATTSTKPPPKKVTGSLLLLGTRLKISKGTVTVTLRCSSNAACNGLFSVTIHVKTRKGKTATAVCTKSQFATYQIGAGKTVTLHKSVHGSCTTEIRAHHGTLAGKFTSRPRTGQLGVIKMITLFL